MVCERGASFGYNNLVSDMRSLAIMRETGCPVVFDATHSVQLPGGQGTASGGQREFVPVLARAAIAAGVSGLFMETHPDPATAMSDGPNAWPLDLMQELLFTLKELDAVVKRSGFRRIASSSLTHLRPIPAGVPMAAYVIAEVKVSDPEQYKQYQALSPGAITAAGGELRRAGRTHASARGGLESGAHGRREVSDHGCRASPSMIRRCTGRRGPSAQAPPSVST